MIELFETTLYLSIALGTLLIALTYLTLFVTTTLLLHS